MDNLHFEENKKNEIIALEIGSEGEYSWTLFVNTTTY